MLYQLGLVRPVLDVVTEMPDSGSARCGRTAVFRLRPDSSELHHFYSNISHASTVASRSKYMRVARDNTNKSVYNECCVRQGQMCSFTCKSTRKEILQNLVAAFLSLLPHLHKFTLKPSLLCFIRHLRAISACFILCCRRISRR